MSLSPSAIRAIHDLPIPELLYRAAETEAGFIELGAFQPSAKGQFVEVNLSPAMLKFAARLGAHNEPEVAELISNLKHIRVNVVGLDDSNREVTVARIETLRKDLAAQGWSKMVTVREPDGGDNVDIQVKQRSDDVIEGLVVTVIDRKGEAVIVNIVGNISADQIGKIANKFDIEPLKKINVKLHGDKPADKAV